MAPVKKTPDINALVSSFGILTISFASGNYIDIDPARLDASIVKEAVLHGLKQKLVDAGAIGRDSVTGRSATALDKEYAVLEVYNRISATDGSATWNKVRDSSLGSTGGLLAAALMKLTGKDRTEITAFLAGKSPEEKAALRKNSKVADIIATLQAAKASDVDTDAMLGDLMSGAANDNGNDGNDGNDDDDYETPNGSIDLD